MTLDPDASQPSPEDDSDRDEEDGTRPRRTGAQGSVLAAAMLAVGEILEPQKTVIEIEQANDDPVDDPPFDLDFGDLPPLN